MKKIPAYLIVLCLVCLLDVWVWASILLYPLAPSATLHFLDVGQGDATLLVLPNNVKILTDAGPDKKVISALEKVLPAADRFIDLAVISHAQKDHYNGFNDILERYRVSAVLFNGREAENSPDWQAMRATAATHNIPFVFITTGGSIRHLDSRITILSPDAARLQSDEPNDTGLVEYVTTPQFSALLTADIDAATEEYLASRFNIRADILKVAHHGSTHSSSLTFLQKVRPYIALIGVGANNRYGHPAASTLARLANISVPVFRTDKNGTITIQRAGDTLQIFTEKQ